MTTKTKATAPKQGQKAPEPAQNGQPHNERITTVALRQQDLMEAVTKRLQDLTQGSKLMIPAGYSVGNAIAAWWLRLQRPIEYGANKGKTPLELVTKESVLTATLDMVVMGLDPAKDQCYPIPYGNRLVCQVSYFGRVSMFRDVYPDARTPRTVVVYEGDEFEFGYDAGELIVRRHVPGEHHMEDGRELGAYCVLEYADGRRDITWMPIKQIHKAWAQGATKGDSPAHKGFPGEMCKKTVIGRATKLAVKSSGHSHLVSAAERQEWLTAEAVMDAEIEEHANQRMIDIGDDTDPMGYPLANADQEEPETGDQESGQEPEQLDPPAERFAGMCERQGLDPTKARKLLAEFHEVDDVRKITNDFYDAAVDGEAAFVKAYGTKFGKLPAARAAEKEKVETGPGW